jgi:hypothetical protein
LRRGGKAPDESAVNDHLKLTVYPARPVQGRVFRLGGGIDRDSGGWLIPMYADNILGVGMHLLLTGFLLEALTIVA